MKRTTTIDDQKIQSLLTRGVENIYPSPKYLEARLKENKKVTLYLGIDPTGPTLHLGHVIPLMKLKEFQDLGHKIILLMGDFTAMIGDPTDKTATRKQLTHKEVLANLKLYKKQASKIISFSGKNKAEFRFNSKWLGKMKFGDVLDLASKMTVQQMLERDMFDKRIKEGKPIYIHEFMYPLMQGYDSVAMNVDGEVGGNDQTFNMLTGRTLTKEIQGKEKFVISTRLLVDASGKKMGKTEGNMLTLADSSNEMFAKVMSWTDSMIIPGFELCTRVSEEQIFSYQESLTNGTNPRDIKLKLAEAITAVFYGETKAVDAKEAFLSTFQKKEIPDEILEIRDKGQLIDILVQHKLVSSKGDFRRLVSGNAVTNLTNGSKVTDPLYLVDHTAVFKIGKHTFVKIITT